jgi:hypothetical protein
MAAKGDTGGRQALQANDKDFLVSHGEHNAEVEAGQRVRGVLGNTSAETVERVLHSAVEEQFAGLLPGGFVLIELEEAETFHKKAETLLVREAEGFRNVLLSGGHDYSP